MSEVLHSTPSFAHSLVIPTRSEEELLVRTLEAASHIRRVREFLLWAQGPMQLLLPHQIMVCINYDEEHQVLNLECLRGPMVGSDVVARLCDGPSSLALRIAQYCTEHRQFPTFLQPTAGKSNNYPESIASELIALGLGNALVHGTDMLVSGSSLFVLFGIAGAINERHLFFFDLILPQLHLTTLRVMPSSRLINDARDALALLSEREREILHWLTLGKSNSEIGSYLHLSPLTVKNHLQRIYRKLNVHNRAHAVSRYQSLPGKLRSVA